MHKALEILMTEHRVINSVLSSLLTFINGLTEGDEEGRKMLDRYIDFFRNFADGCHHSKEEDLLFQKMVDFNFPLESGPLAVMNEEHQQARVLVRSMAKHVERKGPFSLDEIAELQRTAMEFAALLSGHIMKEDNVLYPMAQKALPKVEVLDAMLASYPSFEENSVGRKGVERLLDLAEALKNAYPPDKFKIPIPGRAGRAGR